MKNKMKQFSILLLLPCFVALLLFQTQAYAEEKVYCTASIPVEIKTLGDSVPSGIEHKVVIKSENETNPMPDVKEVTIKDNGKVEIGPMTYTKPGRYNYFISQEAGNAEYFTYDSAVYTVTVSIENDGNGGLKSVIFAVKNGATEKTDDVVFSNTYEAVTTSAVTTKVILEEPTIPKETEVAELPEETVTVITNPPENAPKTGERIISAIVVGILGISMLVLSIVMNKKRKADK